MTDLENHLSYGAFTEWGRDYYYQKENIFGFPKNGIEIMTLRESKPNKPSNPARQWNIYKNGGVVFTTPRRRGVKNFLEQAGEI